MPRFEIELGQTATSSPVTEFNTCARKRITVEAATDYEASKIAATKEPKWTILKIKRI